jgi:plastocyanin
MTLGADSSTLPTMRHKRGDVMRSKRTVRVAALSLAALFALVAVSAASGNGVATVTIRHQMRGCHSWSFGSGAYKPTLSVTVQAGATLKFTNNDVMPHRLIQTAGPKVMLVHPNMNRMASSATVLLTKKGVYRFTTKAGEDYAWAASMKTTGEDNVLHLTVRAK